MLQHYLLSDDNGIPPPVMAYHRVGVESASAYSSINQLPQRALKVHVVSGVTSAGLAVGLGVDAPGCDV